MTMCHRIFMLSITNIVASSKSKRVSYCKGICLVSN